jgi:hypothetical protein
MPDYLMGYGEEIYPEYMGQDNDVDEILDALSGDDDFDEYLGAVPSPMRPKAVMKRYKPRSFRKYPLGLGVTNVGIGATAVITVNPQLPFKLVRLSTAVTGFLIENIQIGTVSQFVAAGAVPSEIFAPDANDVDLKGDTAVPGVAIQITVTNTNAAAADFTGAFLGLVAQ